MLAPSVATFFDGGMYKCRRAFRVRNESKVYTGGSHGPEAGCRIDQITLVVPCLRIIHILRPVFHSRLARNKNNYVR